VYPLAGRLVHEGLVSLAAYRIAARSPHTFSMSASDYGFELLSQTPFDLDAGAWREVLAAERLTEDLLGCVNQAELARRQFREIARIAGLIVPSYPGQARSARSLQASSELFFDVFSEFDPQNMLLGQARREVMERQLEFGRMKRALEAIGRMEIVIKAVPKLTPFAFPLWVDRLRSQLSSEKVEDRIVRMIGHLEDAAGTVAEPEFADLEDAGELPSKARRGRRADGKTKAKVPWRRPRL
jgi:ATP-dependent Lhr-like helicase